MNKFWRKCAVALACLASSFISVAQQRPAADLIITNANVWTVDSSRPHAEAIAVIGERIVAVGTAAEIELWRGRQTKVIDAKKKLVLPGFNDAHVHFLDGSSTLFEVDLKDANSPEEFARRIQAQTKKLSKGEWMLGGNWDDQAFANPQLPTRQMIDAVTPETPVFVNRHDGHMALANSLALKLAGVDSKTPDPPGGKIVRDANGEPTGILKDAAMDYVYKIVPEMKPERRTAVFKDGLKYAASVGMTSLQTMSTAYANIAVFSAIAETNQLTLRVNAVPMETNWQDQAKLGIRHAWGSPYLRLGALKGFADGSLGSTTAYFFEPYLDAPKERGLLSDEMQPLSGMRERMTKADAADLQLCIHAIGDQAISIVLDLFQDVTNSNGQKDRRFRIEHAQHIAPKDFVRFAKLGVIASVQPYHAIDDGRWAENRIGHERSKTTYAFRTLLQNGVKLALGTDWPVAPLDPMQTIYAAVTRATLDGKHPEGWIPEQKITVAEAVEAYTMSSAYAEFQDKVKGSITPGKLADIVMLSDDIFTIPQETIKKVKVQETIVGGKVVYSRAN